jgi:hypothetical protein
MELLGEIPAAALEQDPSVIFALDSTLHITYCNAAWDHFAAANGGPGLVRPAPIGRPLLAYINGPLAGYYGGALRHVLKTGAPWRHTYECSSRATFRKFLMHVFPVRKTQGLLVVNSLRMERPHELSHDRIGAGDYRTSEGVVVMCSHCRRAQRRGSPDQWDWVPEYVEHLPPNTSHGLCNLCLEYYYPK